MKYLFLLSEKFYKFIEWEWNTLKDLRTTKRKNFFLRGSFALLSLFSILFLIFSPPIAFGMLFGEGLKFSIFFIWIWILNLKFFQIRKIDNDIFIINSFFCTFVFIIFLFKTN